MAAFKAHCSFGFWKATLMTDANKMKANQKSAMGHLGKITSLADLPPDKILIVYIKEAARLNDEGIKLPRRKKLTDKKDSSFRFTSEQLYISKQVHGPQ